jgi:decaprenylphospho-beta-D-ribofuranose 2-oxidase
MLPGAFRSFQFFQGENNLSVVANSRLSGWGRVGAVECRVCRPESPRELFALTAGEGTFIPRGLGRSYGDPSVNAGGLVVDCSRLNAMRSFDADAGVVDCEAGVSLRELIAAFLPRGYFLPVTPGTKFVTVGGAIAMDVHGKNHHLVGSFGNFVESLSLLTPAGEVYECSRTEHADLFWATVGGAGLTGLILSARLRLLAVETGYMRVDYRRCRDLDAMLAKMHEEDHRYAYSVAWVDCLARGKHLGRGVLMRGNHAIRRDLGASHGAPLKVQPGGQLPVPVEFPSFVLNPLSIGAFNEAFYLRHGDRDGALVNYDTYFYPLDKLSNWNRMYGRDGFLQYQATMPAGERRGVVRLLEKLGESRRASFLAVLKVMGAANEGWLSYPMPGYTLTLDLPNKPGAVEFLRSLDRVLLDHGGKLYFAKDSCALPETIAAMYPRLEDFRALRGRIDPEERLSSNLARRLGLVHGGATWPKASSL